MMQQIREWFRRFFSDPIGTAVESWVYLVLLGVGLTLLIAAGKTVFQMIRDAVR